MKKYYYLTAVCLLCALVVGTTCCSVKKRGQQAADSAGAECTEQTLEVSEERTLRVYFGEISYGLSPFSCYGERDKMWMQLQYSSLGQIADISRKTEGGDTVYTISLHPNIRCNGGDALDSEDILFNLYLRYDLGYNGTESVSDLPIKGIEEYRYDTAHVTARKKQLKKILKSPDKELKQRIAMLIVAPALEKELMWMESIWQKDGTELTGDKKKESFEGPLDAFIYYYSRKMDYRRGKKSREQVLSDIQKQYGWNYRELSEVTEEDYRSQVESLVLCEWMDSSNVQKTQEVFLIQGIRQISGDTVSVTIEGDDALAQKKLEDMLVVPLAEYGQEEQYCPEKGQYGFERGRAWEVTGQDWREKKGTGAYYLRNQEGDDYWFQCNADYWKEKPATEYLSLSVAPIREEGIKAWLDKMCDGQFDILWLPALKSEEKAEIVQCLEQDPYQYLVAVREGMLFQTETVNATTLPEKQGAENFWACIGQVRKNSSVQKR